MTAADATSPATPVPAGNPARKKALLGLTALVAVAAIGYGTYWALVLNHFETTDNAYVQGHIVQLTPQIGGTVVAVNVDDTDHVKAGQLLVRLDPADARVALEQAEAQLAQAVRETRTQFANNSTLNAQIALRQADVSRARVELARAEEDAARRAPLVQSGAVGKEEFNHTMNQVTAARSSLEAAQSAALAAREQLASNQTLTDGISVEKSPNVLRAAARVRESYLMLQRTQLIAPVDGFVAKRSVQLGQRIAPGAPLLSVIPLQQVWVEANFKENQLRNLRIGQPVTLEADMYGGKVEFSGKIDGLGAGTGAAFALLPAQNATGNWIKVVQRVPVRITLDPQQLTTHPLRVGLSMDVRVDVSKTDGKMLADVPQDKAPAETAVLEAVDHDAELEVEKIIAANLGSRAKAAENSSVRPAKTAERLGVPPKAGGAAVAAAPLSLSVK